MLKSLMSLGLEELGEELDTAPAVVDAPLTPEAEAVIVDPETSVDNAIIEQNAGEAELVQLEDTIDTAEVARDTIADIGEVMADTVEDGTGLKQSEAELADIVLEHFKGVLYGKNKPTKKLAIENFGTTMSRVEGTKLAIEDINSLVAEVDTQLAHARVQRYSTVIKLIEAAINTRGKLAGRANETDVKAKEYFGSGRYNPETNGRDLAPGSLYAHFLFNSGEAVDGKMPTAAVLSGYETTKSVFGTSGYLELIKGLRATVQGATNNGAFDKEKLAPVGTELVAKFNTLFETPRKFTNDHNLIYSVVLPLGGAKLEVSSRLLNVNNDSGWWYGNVSIDKEVLDGDVQPKLGALSNAEVDALLTNITTNLQGNEFFTELVALIEDMVAYNAAFANSRVQSAEIECISDNLICNLIDGFIDYFNVISKNEVKTLNALLDYVNDSIFVHSNYNTPEVPAASAPVEPATPDATPAPAPTEGATDGTGEAPVEAPPVDSGSTEGEAAPADTSTGSEEDNASEAAPASTEGTGEGDTTSTDTPNEEENPAA